MPQQRARVLQLRPDADKKININKLTLKNQFQICEINFIYIKGSGAMSTEMNVTPQTITNTPPLS